MNLSEFLQTAPEFADFNANDVEMMERIMKVKDYPDGHEFFREGARSDTIYMILEGEVAVRHGRGAERGFIDIKRMRQGELFGLVGAIDRTRRHAACNAVGPVRAASLPRTAFDLLYEANSPLPHHFQYLVARQLARDLRSIDKVLRQEFLTEKAGAEITDEAAYTGPDRRNDIDRRKGDRRRY